LGFSPQLVGEGYYGIKNIQGFLTPEKITFYREIAYNALSIEKNSDTKPEPLCPPLAPLTSINPTPCCAPSVPVKPVEPARPQPAPEDSGQGSSFVVKTGLENGAFQFSANSFVSFIYSSFGPFPWQLKYKRHLLFLIETIPWYFLCRLAVLGIFKKIKTNGLKNFFSKYKFILQLFLFNILALGALALYINNFGIIIRIRMPMFISFLCIMTLFINFDKIYEKIFSYGRSWFYRFKHS
jgi:hypothetical protein